MARTILTVQESSRKGVQLVLAAANVDGSYVPNDGKVMLIGKNADASSHTVTVAPTAPVPGGTVSGTPVTVAAGAEFALGPWPPEYYNNALGQILATFDAVTSVTIAAVHVP